MKIKKDDWIEIFRTGDYGKKGIYTRADLDQIVKNFNGEDQVPIVVGHPQTDSPAWGWLGGLRRVGEILQARVADLHADFRKALQDKKFRNRSVRIASTRAGKKLLHLGFLGAALPEVEGLGSLQFNRAERYADYEFSLQKHLTREDFTMEEEIADLKEQSDSLKKQLDELKKQLAAEKQGRKEDQEAFARQEEARRKSDFSAFVETEMIATGRLAKDRKDEAVAFMMSLPDKTDFAVDGKDTGKSAARWFKDFVLSLGKPEFAKELPDLDFSSEQKDSGQLTDLSRHV